MEVNPGHRSFDLVEADVVKALETCARYCSHAMIGNEEIFLPPHENVLTLCKIPVGKIWSLCLPGQWTPCWESCPMVHICFLGRSPRFMVRFESVFGADDLSLEECCQSGMVLREA